ncbi:hypothetical protein KC640_03400, partial [Candidatus Dojkabacteria bacterium]|nr:hypothetical protein [Candidatus Dojkabacteria bacterium]
MNKVQMAARIRELIPESLKEGEIIIGDENMDEVLTQVWQRAGADKESTITCQVSKIDGNPTSLIIFVEGKDEPVAVVIVEINAPGIKHPVNAL